MQDPKFLRPVISYYGGKWRTAPRYPQPLHDTIIEPFAGGAGYSLRHYKRNVVLYDADPIIAEVWKYLIQAPAEEILRIPLLEVGQSVDSLKICQEARWLVGFWVQGAVSAPRKTLSTWAGSNPGSVRFWSARCRERIAAQVEHIRHWRILRASYVDIGNSKATWFVDPPYHRSGKYYRYNKIDYNYLGRWCKDRRGQVVVCEELGADWLPFQGHGPVRGARRTAEEVIYYRET